MTLFLACLSCGVRSNIRVVYGLPGPDLFEKARQGELTFGGCSPDAPPRPWLCKSCEHDDASRRLLEEARRASNET